MRSVHDEIFNVCLEIKFYTSKKKFDRKRKAWRKTSQALRAKWIWLFCVQDYYTTREAFHVLSQTLPLNRDMYRVNHEKRFSPSKPNFGLHSKPAVQSITLVTLL